MRIYHLGSLESVNAAYTNEGEQLFIMKHKFLHSSASKKALALVILVADGVFFSFSDPKNLPGWLMAGGFLLLALSIYIGCLVFARIMKRIGLIEESRRWVVFAVSGFLFILLTLQAIGQLSLRDIAALIPLVVLGYFYFTRISGKDISY